MRGHRRGLRPQKPGCAFFDPQDTMHWQAGCEPAGTPRALVRSASAAPLQTQRTTCIHPYEPSAPPVGTCRAVAWEELPAVVADWEPSRALRASGNGLDDLTVIVDGADEWVTPGGAVILEMAPNQTATITQRFSARGWSARVHIDLQGRDRAVVARRPL